MLVACLPEGDGATGGFADEPSALKKSSSFGFGVGVNECFTLEDFLAITDSLVGKLTTRSGTAYGGTPAGNPALGALLTHLGRFRGAGPRHCFHRAGTSRVRPPPKRRQTLNAHGDPQ